MRTVTVGFSHSLKRFSPFSKAIQYWDGVNYSHVYFQFEPNKYGIPMIYQSSETMLNYMSQEIFLKNNEVRKEFSVLVTEEQYDNLEKTCLISAGLPYGVMQIIGIVIADIFKLKQNPFPSKTKYICSEWVAVELEKLGYNFNKKRDLVKPKDIYKVLNESKI
jgi:hypothetical protein